MYNANFPSITNENNLFKGISISNLSYIHAASDPNWSFHTHSHLDTLEISYVFAGQSALYCGEKFYETHPGDIIIKNCNVMHAEKSDKNNPIEQICINIKGIKIPGCPENTIISEDDTPVFNVASNKTFFDALFKYILDQTVDTMAVDLEKVNCLLESIVEIIYKDYHLSVQKKEVEVKGKDIRPILRYMEENFALNLSLDDLSKKFFISPFYLSKKFKAETGFTINQYLISCRMGEAERLLIFSDAQIKDIAIQCGYENLSYFYSTFKKYTGCTPVEFKEKYESSLQN